MFNIHCSKLARPMVCAGFLKFRDLPKEEPNDAAKEGTACGEVLERLLTNQPIGTHASNGVPFDDDMIYYATELYERISSEADGPILCEQKIDWQTSVNVWIRGKYDASYINKDGVLCIDDLKYGWGIVEVKDNWQLTGYAIGEVMRRNQYFAKIRVRILQPRPHHPDGPIREWYLTYDELLALKEKIEARFAEIAVGEQSLVTGHQCKYCEALPFCPANNKAFFNGVDVIEDFLQDEISNEEIARQLEILDRVGELFKTRKASLEMLAISRLKSGELIPNYSTVESHGDRQWLPYVTAEVIESLTGKNITDRIMLSPAKAEKMGVPKELVSTMVSRKFLGVKLKKVDSANLANTVFGDPNAK